MGWNVISLMFPSRVLAGDHSHSHPLSLLRGKLVPRDRTPNRFYFISDAESPDRSSQCQDYYAPGSTYRDFVKTVTQFLLYMADPVLSFQVI